MHNLDGVSSRSYNELGGKSRVLLKSHKIDLVGN